MFQASFPAQKGLAARGRARGYGIECMPVSRRRRDLASAMDQIDAMKVFVATLDERSGAGAGWRLAFAGRVPPRDSVSRGPYRHRAALPDHAHHPGRRSRRAPRGRVPSPPCGFRGSRHAAGRRTHCAADGHRAGCHQRGHPARAAYGLCAARAPHRSPPIARSPARDVRWRSNAARVPAPAPDLTDLSIAIQEATT